LVPGLAPTAAQWSGYFKKYFGPYAHVPDNAALGRKSAADLPSGIWRDDYAIDNRAPPLFYAASGSACILNEGKGDNGSQVRSADGKCWLATFPAGPADVREWGARCDNGVTNDTKAINSAIAYARSVAGSIRGPEKSILCGVSGNLDVGGVKLSDIGFLQLSPRDDRRHTLTNENSGLPMYLVRVKVDRGSDPTAAQPSIAAGILSKNTDYSYMEDVDVTGNGSGVGILFNGGTGHQLIRPYVHDMYWAHPKDPGTDQIAAIWGINGVTNWYIDNPRIVNITGSIGGGRQLRYQAFGIACSGCDGVTTVGGFIKNIADGIAIASDYLNTNIWFYGTVCEDVGATCQKWTHNVTDSGSIGCRAVRPGLWGVAWGTGTSHSSKHVYIYDFETRNAGANTHDPRAAGFSINPNEHGGAFQPVDARCINCRAIDDQESHTMRYGFRNAVGDIADWTIINPQISNPVTADYLNKTTVVPDNRLRMGH